METVAEILAFAGMTLISASIMVLIADVSGRKTVGFTIFGINDINQLLTMACVCLAMPLVFLREGHVGVDFATGWLGPRQLAALKMVVSAICFGWVGVLAHFAFIQARGQIAMGSSSPTIEIPIVWFWAPLLLGLTASAVACLANVARHLIVVATGQDALGAPN